jgi:hypothetical protein
VRTGIPWMYPWGGCQFRWPHFRTWNTNLSPAKYISALLVLYNMLYKLLKD